MNERMLRAALLCTAICGTPLGCADEPRAAPVAPPRNDSPPAPSPTLPNPRMAVDTSRTEVPAVLRGAPGYALIGRLASPDGQREIVLEAPDGSRMLIATADWNILAGGVSSDGRHLSICWNVLTGPHAKGGEPPDPADGLELRCRYGVDNDYGPPVRMDESVPVWLQDLTSRDVSNFTVDYYRDSRGTLLGARQPGDGKYRRPFNGVTGFGTPTPR